MRDLLREAAAAQPHLWAAAAPPRSLAWAAALACHTHTPGRAPEGRPEAGSLGSAQVVGHHRGQVEAPRRAVALRTEAARRMALGVVHHTALAVLRTNQEEGRRHKGLVEVRRKGQEVGRRGLGGRPLAQDVP